MTWKPVKILLKTPVMFSYIPDESTAETESSSQLSTTLFTEDKSRDIDAKNFLY